MFLRKCSRNIGSRVISCFCNFKKFDLSQKHISVYSIGLQHNLKLRNTDILDLKWRRKSREYAKDTHFFTKKQVKKIVILFTKNIDTVHCKSKYCLLLITILFAINFKFTAIIIQFTANHHAVHCKSSYGLLQIIMLFTASQDTVYCLSPFCLL